MEPRPTRRIDSRPFRQAEGERIRDRPRIVVVIPALNEETAIGAVVGDVPGEWVHQIIVVDNGSTDHTARRAVAAGAHVIHENRRGYGWACRRGAEYARENDADIVVFLDGDHSDHPEELPRLVGPLVRNRADLVLGSRLLGGPARGAMLPHAAWGTRIACVLLRVVWRTSFTDLGPFRALRLSDLESLEMREMTYGWTVEMQIKAARAGLRCLEVPVAYRRRLGTSKISGTLRGTLRASVRIIWTIIHLALGDALRKRRAARRGPIFT